MTRSYCVRSTPRRAIRRRTASPSMDSKCSWRGRAPHWTAKIAVGPSIGSMRFRFRTLGRWRSSSSSIGRQPMRQIDIDWLEGSTELALQLDSLTNNTSLVLAIELPDGDVLLFAADAQVGNWLSWQGLEWEIGGKKVTGPDLLKRTIFYKVGHHGSHNATLPEKGLEQMEKLRVAMLPVDQAMAKKKHWDHMPLDELVSKLNKKAKGVVLRVDQPMPTTQEQVVEDRLFFEVAF